MVYASSASTISNAVFYMYGSLVILSVNSDYFLNDTNQLIFVMVKCCLLWGTDRILKYYLDEIRLQKVKRNAWIRFRISPYVVCTHFIFGLLNEFD
jgi:hypothetical protein